MKRITVTELARACNVSQPAVSQALNNTGRLRPETRARILKAARQLGYRPNKSARSMRDGRFNNIAIVTSVDPARSYMPQPLLSHLVAAAEANDLHVTLAQMDDQRLTDTDYMPHFLQEWMCDGMLITYQVNIPSAMRHVIEEYGLPAVWLNADLPQSAVRPDDHQGAYDAVKRLHKLGHRRIALFDNSFHHTLNGKRMHYSRFARRDGYLAAVEDLGLEPIVQLDPADTPGDQVADVISLAKSLLTGPDRPTGIVTPVGGESLIRAAAENGLIMGRDVSLVTVGFQCGATETTLATMSMHGPNIADAAIDLLNRHIETRRPQPTRVVPMVYVDGYTAGPAPVAAEARSQNRT